ncbi:MAG: RNA 2',3'-cyclic phosphodiesterase, partial [Candidatus Bipolaricaulota bacterium]
GEIEPALCTDLHRLARELLPTLPPFTFRVDRVSAFPGVERPRVLWVGGDAPAAFRSLLERLGAGLQDLGFEPARRERAFHITIARLKGRPDDALRRSIRPLDDDGWSFPADRLVLMESRLSGRGAHYDPLFSIRLGAAKTPGGTEGSCAL